MKKRIFFVILLVLAVSLAGCTTREPVESVLDPDFRVIETREFVHLDGGLTGLKNLENPQFMWEIGEKEMTGETVKISVPGEVIRIRLTVKAVDPDGETVIADKAIDYDPFESGKYKRVRIVDHYRLKDDAIGVKWQFYATSPPEAAYWLWRFEGEDYWHVYEKNNMSYSFPEKGSQKVRLRIWDEEMKDIGEEYSTYVKVK